MGVSRTGVSCKALQRSLSLRSQSTKRASCCNSYLKWMSCALAQRVVGETAAWVQLVRFWKTLARGCPMVNSVAEHIRPRFVNHGDVKSMMPKGLISRACHLNIVRISSLRRERAMFDLHSVFIMLCVHYVSCLNLEPPVACHDNHTCCLNYVSSQAFFRVCFRSGGTGTP